MKYFIYLILVVSYVYAAPLINEESGVSSTKIHEPEIVVQPSSTIQKEKEPIVNLEQRSDLVVTKPADLAVETKSESVTNVPEPLVNSIISEEVKQPLIIGETPVESYPGPNSIVAEPIKADQISETLIDVVSPKVSGLLPKSGEKLPETVSEKVVSKTEQINSVEGNIKPVEHVSVEKPAVDPKPEVVQKSVKQAEISENVQQPVLKSDVSAESHVNELSKTFKETIVSVRKPAPVESQAIELGKIKNVVSQIAPVANEIIENQGNVNVPIVDSVLSDSKPIPEMPAVEMASMSKVRSDSSVPEEKKIGNIPVVSETHSIPEAKSNIPNVSNESKPTLENSVPQLIGEQPKPNVNTVVTKQETPKVDQPAVLNSKPVSVVQSTISDN